MAIQGSARRSIKGIRLSGIAALLFAVGTASVSAQNVTDVILGSGSFQIPFNIANNGNAPREVELYMASTGDESSGQWRLLDRQPPGAGKFQLSETPDGTFWFATRTIDSSGRPHPPGPIEPELKVIVDTGEPVVHLAADASAEGKVVAEFTVDDASGADQMTVHYVTDTTPQWQTAKIIPTARGGKFQFEPTDNWQQLSLRVRVLDRAGNETIIKKRVQKPRIAVAGTTRLASGPLGFGTPAYGPTDYGPSEFNNPFNANGNAPNANTRVPNTPPPYGITATPPAGIGPSRPIGSLVNSEETLPPPSTAQQISDDFGMPEIEMLPDQTGLQGNLTEVLPAPTGETAPRPKTAAEAMRPLAPEGPGFPLTEEIRPQQNQPTLAAPKNTASNALDTLAPQTPFQTEIVPAPYGQPPAPNRLNGPALGTRSLDQNDTEGPAAPSPWSPIDPTRSRNPSRQFSQDSFSQESPRSVQGQRQVQGRPSLDETRSKPARSSNGRLDLDQLAKRSVVRHSDSRQFSLDYEIEAIGGRGVEAIELYGTTDGGQSWKRWGDDPDRISPFDIETNGEGIFGFNIVVVAANGLASPRPLPGDVPDIVVVVDETKPEVTITGARYGEADRAGSLVMQYRCEDEYLMSRPITLAFSESPDGPWTTIAAGLRNLGDYVWPADPQLPRQIYLRIDATDQAGNVGGYVLEEPIDTRGLAPRARIRAFRSIPTR